LTTVNSTSDEEEAATCHMLPCNIDFEGMAKTHLYFVNEPIQVENGITILASTFRGRGLLAVEKEKQETDDADDVGVVVGKPHLISLEEDQIILKAPINNILEWHHEHNPQTIKLFHTENSRLTRANDWIQIAKALHDPLPFEDD